MQPEARRSVLVVDDNRDFAASLVLLFAQYEVRQAWTGGDGLRLARQRPAHLYLVDHDLPDMTGIDVCRGIRAFDPNTPVLMCSALALDERTVAAAGANGFFRKADDIRRFMRGVEGFIDSQALRDETACAAEEAAIRAALAERVAEGSTRHAGMRGIVAEGRRWLEEIRALRAQSFRVYIEQGGARAGFVQHWPAVASFMSADAESASGD